MQKGRIMLLFVFMVTVTLLTGGRSEAGYEQISLANYGIIDTYGINDMGLIAGMRHGGVCLTLDFSTGVADEFGGCSQPNGINNSGQVVGVLEVFEYGEYSQKVFLYSGGQLDYFPSDAGNLTAYAINNNGQIVGSEFLNGAYNAVMWDNGVEVAVNLGTISEAKAINDAGKIAGYDYGRQEAFTFFNGNTEYLGINLFPTGINHSGQIVGYAMGSSSALLWDNGFLVDLGSLGGGNSAAFDINNAGKITGYSNTQDGQFHAFLYENNQMYDLDSSGSFSIGKKINEAGVVVGYSFDGGQHGVLWKPADVAPEPLSWLLFVSGGVVLLLRKLIG